MNDYCGQYILDEHTPVKEPDLLKWGKWMAQPNVRRVARDESVVQGIKVSTVFLGLDHAYPEGSAPILFETMVFKDGDEVDTARCETWEQAEKMHKRYVEKAIL